MEEYLEVTADNLADLMAAGFNVEIGDELTCEVEYSVMPADPSVGLFSPQAEIESVTCESLDMERFFDMDRLAECADLDRMDTEQDMLDRAADERFERMREEREGW